VEFVKINIVVHFKSQSQSPLGAIIIYFGQDSGTLNFLSVCHRSHMYMKVILFGAVHMLAAAIQIWIAITMTGLGSSYQSDCSCFDKFGSPTLM
jgi:hypothetical protein